MELVPKKVTIRVTKVKKSLQACPRSILLTSSNSTNLVPVHNLSETLNGELTLDTSEQLLEAPLSDSCQIVNEDWFTWPPSISPHTGEEGDAAPNNRVDSDTSTWKRKSKSSSGGGKIRQGMWSAEETDRLKKNVTEYCTSRGISDPETLIFAMTREERGGFYRSVSDGINRPLFAVYRRVLRMYDSRNHVGRYSCQEVERLVELRSRHGNDWQAIASALGRSTASVKDRSRLLKKDARQGPWSTTEEDLLAQAVAKCSVLSCNEGVEQLEISWSDVASQITSRTEKQCRAKWINYLQWKRNSGVEWKKSDDVQLICRLIACGESDESLVKWDEVGQMWPAVRSCHWLKAKWWNLKRRVVKGSTSCCLQELCVKLLREFPAGVLDCTQVELVVNEMAQKFIVQCPATNFVSRSSDVHKVSSESNTKQMPKSVKNVYSLTGRRKGRNAKLSSQRQHKHLMALLTHEDTVDNVTNRLNSPLDSLLNTTASSSKEDLTSDLVMTSSALDASKLSKVFFNDPILSGGILLEESI